MSFVSSILDPKDSHKKLLVIYFEYLLNLKKFSLITLLLKHLNFQSKFYNDSWIKIILELNNHVQDIVFEKFGGTLDLRIR